MGDKNFPLPPVSPLIGSTFRNFIKIIQGHRVRPKYYPKLFLTALTILITSPFRWYEKWFFNSRLASARIEAPIFIIGHWRSGTTYLHNLMSQDPKNGFVTTYQTVFPHLLTSKSIFGPFMNKVMPKKRPSDNMELAVDFPQEEEFGFLNCNPNSIYNFCYFPKYFQMYYDTAVHHLGLSNDAIEDISKDYVQLLKKAQVISGRDRMVIKSPINTARIAFLDKNFPDAKFIHIVRNPYSVYLSARKFFTNLLPTLWLEEVSLDTINDLVLELYTKLYKDFFNQKQLVNDRIVEVKYELLEEKPLEVLSEIYAELNLSGFEKALPAFQTYVDHHKDYKKNVFIISDKEIKLINKMWGKYIKHWGYQLPENIKVSA